MSNFYDGIAWLSTFHTRAEITRMFGVDLAKAWYGSSDYMRYNRTAFIPNGLPDEIRHMATDP